MYFTRSPVHPFLIINSKQTWLAVLDGGLIPRFGSSSEKELSLGRLEIMIDWTE